MTPLTLGLVVAGLIYLPLPLVALFRAVRNETGGDLARWILVILIFPVIGALIYLLAFGRGPEKA
jgi:hypothetical protein